MATQCPSVHQGLVQKINKRHLYDPGWNVQPPSLISRSRASLSFLLSSSVTLSFAQTALLVLSLNFLCRSLFLKTSSICNGAIGPKTCSGSTSCCCVRSSRRAGEFTQAG